MSRTARWALCLTLLTLFVPGCDSRSGRRPDVVLVILDTVRADHLSSYGYARETTPELDRLAAEGERYEAAFAQSCWTLPTVATLLTGLTPGSHGAGWGDDGLFGIRDSVVTVAERLTAAGYRTGAVMNVEFLTPEISSLDRGFEHYDALSGVAESNVPPRDARATTDAALDWLRTLGDDPAFVVVHYFDPHITYDPPPPYDSLFHPSSGALIPVGFGSAEQVAEIRDGRRALDERERAALVARYDGELRYTDAQFGRLRDGLERMGRWDDAVVVVVADHGEEFWDHGGFEHGHSHHREMLRVPLIVRRPGGGVGHVSTERVRQLDVVPTMLDAVGLPIPEEFPGRPLGGAAARYSIAAGSLWGGDLVSVRSDDGVVILDRTTGRIRFYESDDPLEQVPSAAPAPADLRTLLDGVPPPPTTVDVPVALTEGQKEALRRAGYLR